MKLTEQEVDLLAWICIAAAGELQRTHPKWERIRDLYTKTREHIEARAAQEPPT